MGPKRKRLAPRIFAGLIFIAAIAVPSAYVYVYEPPLDVTVAPIGRGRVEETVSAIASGTVLAEKDSMIAAGFIGIVRAILVEEGSRVNQGDLLVELEHTDLDAQVALAEANVESGKARLESVRIGADVFAEVSKTRESLAQAQLAAARQDYDRIQQLSQKGGLSQSDLDKMALALRVAEENAAQARAGLREDEARRQDIAAAESGVKQLEAALAVAKAAREKAFVKAPFPGVVAKKPVDVGEAVALGVPMLQLVQSDTVYVRAPFDEANAADIAVGQTARLTLDAHRGETFEGEVTYISPVVSLNLDLSRTLDVKIKILDRPGLFVAGMSADVTILVDQKEDVLFVPSEALVREQWAFVAENGRAVRREVTTGVGNWTSREVLEGLAEGDALITSVTLKALEDGVKVRVVERLEP